jgi:dihydroneopterin aldolase/D-erythro-7,8-dihydroneopterin triphosphate epimerase
MDKITIHNLNARAIIGTLPRERVRKQPVVADIILYADLRKASESDRLDGTPDYAKVTDQVLRHIASSRYRLIERLADSIACLCLRQPAVRSVEVTITKPCALGRKALVSVTLKRSSRSGKG